MGDFLMCILQYVVIFIALAAIGVCGGFVGYKLRKSKDAKKAAQTEE